MCGEKLLMMDRGTSPKHVEFYSKNTFEKLVHLVGFIIRMCVAVCLSDGTRGSWVSVLLGSWMYTWYWTRLFSLCGTFTLIKVRELACAIEICADGGLASGEAVRDGEAKSCGWQKGCSLYSQKFDCFEIMSTGRPWPQNGHKCHRRRRGYVCVALRLAILRLYEYRIVLPLNVPQGFGRGTSGLWVPFRRKKWIRLKTKI